MNRYLVSVSRAFRWHDRSPRRTGWPFSLMVPLAAVSVVGCGRNRVTFQVDVNRKIDQKAVHSVAVLEFAWQPPVASRPVPEETKSPAPSSTPETPQSTAPTNPETGSPASASTAESEVPADPAPVRTGQPPEHRSPRVPHAGVDRGDPSNGTPHEPNTRPDHSEDRNEDGEKPERAGHDEHDEDDIEDEVGDEEEDSDDPSPEDEDDDSPEEIEPEDEQPDDESESDSGDDEPESDADERDEDDEPLPSYIMNAGKTVADQVAAALLSSGRYAVRERNRLDRILEEHDLAAVDIVRRRQYALAGGLLEADGLILGEVLTYSQRMGAFAKVSFSFRCVDTRSGDVIWSVSAEKDVFGLRTPLTAWSRELVREVVAELERKIAEATGTPTPPVAPGGEQSPVPAP